MPFDGIVLSAVQQELSNKLKNSRIDKIYQPSSDKILLHVRQRTGGFKLLLASHAYDARVHLTTASFTNPFNPPLFCMVLRKHLEGGKIIKIEQDGLERQLTFFIEALDELGQLKTKKLIVEIMGKHSNILLVDSESDTIIDAIKRFTHAVSRHREVLPGRTYIAPPAQNKLNPLTISEEEFRQTLLSCELTARVSKVLVNKIAGLSTVLAKEIIYRTGFNPEITIETLGEYDLARIWQELQSIADTIKTGNFKPSVYFSKGVGLDYAAVPLHQLAYAEEQQFSEISEALDVFFQDKQAREDLEKAKQVLRKTLSKELERNKKKERIQEDTTAQAKLAEPFRLKGELITANIYRIAKGDSTVLVDNFYDPENKQLSIDLNPDLTPSQNAQWYFKKYNKAKAGAVKTEQQLFLTKEEIFYLDSILQAIESTNNLEDLAEIKKEMIGQGYLAENYSKHNKKPKGKEEQAKAKPLDFKSSDGLTILVGKNNKQNDWLTMKLAKDHDLWLHVKDLPGSHVIIQTAGRSIPDTTLLEAATLAAYYSKGQYSSQVPVDWTYKKHVRKPSGAKPGMVIYDHHQTIYVTPEESLVQRLKARP